MDDDRSGFEWGLASVAIGLGLMVVGFQALVSVEGMFNFVNMNYELPRARVFVLGGYTLAAASEVAALAGVVAGIRSILAARRTRRPLALGLAGVMLNTFAVGVWVAACLCWHSLAVAFFA